MAYVEKEETSRQIRSREAKIYIGLQEVTGHLIHDIKIDFQERPGWYPTRI